MLLKNKKKYILIKEINDLKSDIKVIEFDSKTAYDIIED